MRAANIAEALEAAVPVWVIDAPDVPAGWTPRPGALLPLDPGRVSVVLATGAPPWEWARRLLEEP